ncbi:MAG: amidohydrolase family protein, partial [Firmicutes bacterium]|nr:amidohydrolase family protein [Bacillota bacterium]
MTAVDLLIEHGCIIDGTGNPRYRGDVAIKDGVVVEIGGLSDEIAKRVIDAEELVVCPGFIDVHTHSDLVLLADPINEAKLRQGVTTEILGQDGLSYAPLSAGSLEFMRHYLSGLNGNPKVELQGESVKQFLEQFHASVNVAYLVPHGALRLEAMGMDDRPPTKRELAIMQQACAKALSDGAVGLSTALAYAPCTYAATQELIGLNEVVAQYNGCFVV